MTTLLTVMNDVDLPLVGLPTWLMWISSCNVFHLAFKDCAPVVLSDPTVPASMRSIQSTADWYSLGMIFFRCSHRA